MKNILIIITLFTTTLFAQTPGGVATTNMSLWLSGDDNVTNVVSGELRWADKIEAASISAGGTDTGYDVYQNRDDGFKAVQSELFNFHNTFSFDGNNDYFAIESLNYTSGTTISDVYAFVVYKTDFNNSDYNGNWSLIDFDRSDAYNFYIHGDGRLAMSYREGISSNTVNGTTANVSDFEATTPSNDDIPHIGTFIINNSAIPTKKAQMRLDGKLDFDDTSLGDITLSNEDRFGYIGAGSEAETEDEEVSGDIQASVFYEGEIAEIILFDKGELTADEVIKIESYLALKYGITLSNSGGGTAGDYTYDNGVSTVTIWDASANATHHNNVTGLIRSTTSHLDQKVTKSIGGNLILATTNDYTSANNDGGRTSLSTDESYLIFGESTDVGTTSFNATRNIYNKTWFFEEGANDTGDVFIAIPIAQFSADKTVELIVSSDATFTDGVDTTISSTTNGDYYYWEVNIADGDQLTFLEEKSTYASPGGVSTANMAIWLSADANVVPGASFEWNDRVVDIVGNGSDEGYSANKSTLSTTVPTVTTPANLFNYNQSLNFDGSAFLAVETLQFPSGTNIDDFYTFVVYKTALVSATSTANWSFLDFDKSDVFNFYAEGDGDLAMGYLAGTYAGTTASNNDIPHIGTFIFDSSLTNENIVKLDGGVELESDVTSTSITTGGTRFGYIGSGSEATSEDSNNGGGGPYQGDIAEIIFIYNGGITANDILRIESYLALKYGVTLDVENGFYVDSHGDILWNNTDYWNNIAGLIIDKETGAIDQRIATPASGVGIVVSTDSDLVLANNDASRTPLTNDGDYLLFGDNGETGFEVSTILDGGATLNVMRKKWLFKEGDNDVGNVYISIPIDQFPAGSTVQMVVSSDDTFDAGDTKISSSTNGSYYQFNTNISDGDYVSFLSTDSKIAGVSVTRYTMILRADQDLENTGSSFSWTDASFNQANAYQNTTANIPSSTEFMNFNPTLTFDGSDDFLAIANKHYDAGQEITDLHTYVAYKTDYNEEDGPDYNDNWSFYDFDRSEAFNMYIQPSGQLSFSYRSDGQEDRNSLSLGNDNLPHIAEFIFDADETGATNDNNTKMKFDGNVEFDVDDTTGPIVVLQTRYGFIGDGSEASSENGTRNNFYYDGQISEILLADREAFTAAETLQLESYLALKYGITLNSNLLTYKNSQGVTVWDNLDYWHGIAGLIKDDVDSDIDQRVAQSTSGQDIIVSLDEDFVSSNLDASRTTVLTEGSSLLFGNDGSGTGFEALAGGVAGTDFITARKWLFKELGTDPGVVHIAIPKSFLPSIIDPISSIKYIISSDDNFDITGGADVQGAVTDGAVSGEGDFYHFSVNISDGDRLAFTFELAEIPSPGAISNGLQMWIKSNKNVTSATNLISSIGDSGIESTDLQQTTNLDKPTLVDDGTFNFNPSSAFDGDAQHFFVKDLNYTTAGEVSKMYTWVVYNTTSTAATNGSFLSFDGDEYFDLSVSGASGNLNFSYATSSGTNDETSSTSTNDGNTKVAAFIHDNTIGVNETIVRLNGVEDFARDVDDTAIGTGSVDRFGYVGDGSTAALEDGGSTSDYFEGNIAEIIYYEGETLGATEINRVESYLAIKYGFTLSGNYVNSENTTIWDATTNAAYHNNVFGLMNDESSELEQKQSKSIEENSILTISMNSGSIVTTNEEITTSFPSTNADLGYLLIGNNGGGAAIGLEVIAGRPPVGACLKSDKKINREWLVNSSESFTDLTLSFDLTGVPDPNNYTLIVNTDGDSDFETGSVNAEYTGVLTDNELLVTGVVLADGNLFRLESTAETGAIIFGNGTWFGGSGTDNALSTGDTGQSVQILDDVTLPTDAVCDCINIDDDVIVTVSDGNYLQLENEIEFENAASSLYLLGTAELIQTGTGASPDENTGDGSIYKILGEATDSRHRYNYLSSPVNTSGTYSLSGNMKINTGATLADNTDPTFIDNDSDGFGTTISSKWMYTLNSSGAYTAIDESTSLSPGVGFTMKGTNQSNNYNFIGSPNNGDITALTLADNNFAIVGNPYPSAIDAEKFNTAMSGITTQVVYFWDQPTGDSHYQDDYDGGYSTFKGGVGSGVGVAAAGVTSATEPTKIIKPGQGFVVSSDADGVTVLGGNIQFTNDMRVTNTNSGASKFYRTAVKEEVQQPIIRLGFEFETGRGTYHRQLATTPNGGTLSYDLGEDALMFDNKSNDAYWLLEDSDNKYVITNVPYITEDLELPIGVVVDSEKEVTFKLDAVENVSDQIYLLDKDTEALTNLTGGDSYKVLLDSGDDEGRFNLVFKPDSLENDEVEKTKTVIYVENKIMTIVLEQGNVEGVLLYDLLGKELLRSTNQKLDISGLPSQIYIVKIKSKNDIIIKKIFLN